MSDNSGFELEITELRLGLPGVGSSRRGSVGVDHKKCHEDGEKKRVFSEAGKGNVGSTNTGVIAVGWPPVCSYRKRSIGSEKECMNVVETSSSSSSSSSKKFVKISMDGVPFLRKIDVNCYQDYSHFVASFEKLFGCLSLEDALEDADNNEYVVIYEDKDGDWLLVGDVPWSLFVESCKRLRIMKSGDVKGFEFQCKKQHRK